MATAGPNAPVTLADDAAVGTVAWTNPGNAAASDNIYATAVLGIGVISHYLKATNFGFAIPTSATITGVSLASERHLTVGTNESDNITKLVVSGAVVGANRATQSWSTSDTVQTYTWDAAELLSLGVTPAIVNASDFGIVFSGTVQLADTLSIDLVTLTITYTPRSLVIGSYTVSNRIARGNR